MTEIKTDLAYFPIGEVDAMHCTHSRAWAEECKRKKLDNPNPVKAFKASRHIAAMIATKKPKLHLTHESYSDKMSSSLSQGVAYQVYTSQTIPLKDGDMIAVFDAGGGFGKFSTYVCKDQVMEQHKWWGSCCSVSFSDLSVDSEADKTKMTAALITCLQERKKELGDELFARIKAIYVVITGHLRNTFVKTLVDKNAVQANMISAFTNTIFANVALSQNIPVYPLPGVRKNSEWGFFVSQEEEGSLEVAAAAQFVQTQSKNKCILMAMITIGTSTTQAGYRNTKNEWMILKGDFGMGLSKKDLKTQIDAFVKEFLLPTDWNDEPSDKVPIIMLKGGFAVLCDQCPAIGNILTPNLQKLHAAAKQ